MLTFVLKINCLYSKIKFVLTMNYAAKILNDVFRKLSLCDVQSSMCNISLQYALVIMFIMTWCYSIVKFIFIIHIINYIYCTTRLNTERNTHYRDNVDF